MRYSNHIGLAPKARPVISLKYPPVKGFKDYETRPGLDRTKGFFFEVGSVGFALPTEEAAFRKFGTRFSGATWLDAGPLALFE